MTKFKFKDIGVKGILGTEEMQNSKKNSNHGGIMPKP